MKDQKKPSENIIHCIYCLRTNKDVSFTTEHIIPQCVKGAFVLDNFVCVVCNSWLGSNVDHQILKVPEIVNALEKFNLNDYYHKVIKHHYTISGKLSEEIELKFGRLEKNGAIFPGQNLADGSYIEPENTAFESMLKRLKRDERLKESGLTDSEIETRLMELKQKHDKSEVGEEVISPELRIGLIKRSSQLEITINPKVRAEVLPLIAKIAYEFYFSISGRKFFNKENHDLRQSLGALITRKESKQKPLFIREKPFHNDYQPFHIIRLDLAGKSCVLHVSFFGNVQYLLVTKSLSSDVYEDVKKVFELEDLKIIGFKQRIDTYAKSFAFKSSKELKSYDF